MPDRDTPQEDVEHALLSGLCCGAVSLTERDAVLGKLAAYGWRQNDHRVIFEALRRSRHTDARALREYLVAEITRLGFPDIDVAPFFQAAAAQAPDVEKLLRILLAARRDATESQ